MGCCCHVRQMVVVRTEKDTTAHYTANDVSVGSGLGGELIENENTHHHSVWGDEGNAVVVAAVAAAAAVKKKTGAPCSTQSIFYTPSVWEFGRASIQRLWTVRDLVLGYMYWGYVRTKRRCEDWHQSLPPEDVSSQLTDCDEDEIFAVIHENFSGELIAEPTSLD